jgi:5-methylcytosine-specific restriction endonuclease McrA
MRLHDVRSILKGARAKYDSNHFKPQLVERYGDGCMRCGKQVYLTLDHIKPVSLGGKTELSNLQLLCHKCNQLKADREIDFRPSNQQETNHE